MSIRSKVLSIAIIALVLGIVAQVVTSGYMFTREYSRALEARAVALGEGLGAQLDRIRSLGIPLNELVGFEKQCQELVDRNPGISYAVVLDVEGQVLFRSDRVPAKWREPGSGNVEGGDRVGPSPVTFQHKGEYEVALPVLGRGGDSIGEIRIGISAVSIDEKIEHLLNVSAFVSVLSVSFAVVLLVFALRHWVTNPLSRLLGAMRHLSRSEKGAYGKIEASSRDEIGMVSATFNSLIDDLNASIETISLHSEKLEALVEERTAELKSANVRLSDDLAERQTIEAALRDSESKYRALSQEFHALLDNIPDAIALYSPEMRIIWANRSASEISGVEVSRVTGELCYEVFHGRAEPCETCAVRTSFETGKPATALIRRPDGRAMETRTVPLRDSDEQIVSVMEMGRDVTEHLKLEARLRQAQKSEAIGTIAGGIAHDFNNILAAIIGYTELARLEVLEEGPITEFLDEVLKSSVRAKDLVRQILSFSRQGADQMPLPIDLGALVKETMGILRASLPTTIEIRLDIPDEPLVTLGDATQIRQVLINLCTNAADAMKKHGGILGIKIEGVRVDSDSTARTADLAIGDYVGLAVSDTGSGMDSRTMERIFDPYFTTKEIGEGSGLGLAVVQGIVRRFGGSIAVTSGLGKGSSFQIHFPRIVKPVESPEEKGYDIPRGIERVLLVDDEQSVANVGEALLRNLGYRVIVRTDSREALKHFESHPDELDLVITDYTMPGLTGGELAKIILRLRPGMPIILCTGFNEEISEDEAREIGIARFLMKPLSRRDLAVNVRKALDQRLVR
ncbi:MAG: ATP-binding protein [Syntrophobacteraceae bacterium]